MWLLEFLPIIELVFFALAVVLYATDKLIVSGLLLYALVGAVLYLNPQLLQQITTSNIGVIGVIVGAFIAIGLLTTFTKWILFSNGIANEIADIRKSITEGDKDSLRIKWSTALSEYAILGFVIKEKAERYLKNIPNLRRALGKNFLADKDLVEVHTAQQLSDLISPDAKSHSDILLTWFIQWPLVLCDLLFNKLVHKICVVIVDTFSGVFNWVSSLLIKQAIK